MTKAKNTDKADGGNGSLTGFLLALVILTLGGAGAGVFFGIQMGGVPMLSSVMSGSDAARKSDGAGANGGDVDADSDAVSAAQEDSSAGTNLVALDPIFANLAEPKDVWLRLEAALMIKAGTKQRNVLVTQLSQDLMQFLRTVKLAQIEDASGLQFLRDDLNDVVRTRSGGQVSEILVKGLIVE